MKRRGAILSLLLTPFAVQSQELSLTTTNTRETLALWFPKKPSDRMMRITWSDGTSLVLTEADVRVALEEDV